MRRFPELSITELETEGLSPLDAAFAHAVSDAVIRRWLTLRFLIERQLTRPWEELDAKVAAVLLAATAQILLLDRVPAHAAINHAVEWTKQRVHPRAAGMVNAVLRKVAGLKGEGERRERWTDQRDELPLSDGSALVLTSQALPENPLERLAAATGAPAALLRKWSKSMPQQEVRRLAHHTLAQPPVILNTMHAQAPLPPAPLLEPHSAPGHHVFHGSRGELVGLLSERDDIWVQDPASSLAVGAAANLRARLILDLCAGQGTKTRQLAAMFPDATIIATDVDQARFQTLAAVFAGHKTVQVLPHALVSERYRDAADLILLDVPCSNTGVLARRPEAKYRINEQTITSLRDVQRQIIADAVPLLRGAAGGGRGGVGGAGRAGGVGGRGTLLYSTCSLEPEENQQQAAWASRWHGFKGKHEHHRPPAALPGDPPHQYTDGSYALLLT